MFAMVVLAVNVVLSVGMDTLWPGLRDVEYTARRTRIQARVAANLQRDLTIMLGSSRSDFGIRPLVNDDGPLLCNASQVGAGPLLQLLTLQRLLHDGISPKHVIAEFWPPFLMGTGTFSEVVRIDPHRLYPSDEPFIRGYLPDPEETLRLMREIRRTPVWNHRQRLMSQTLATWLPLERRLDGGANRLDAAGWLPGPSGPPNYERAAAHFQPLFAAYEVDPLAVRALKEMIDTCERRGIRLTFVWLPESSAFRSWSPPTANDAVNVLRGQRLIVARDWIADEHLPDGYHLSPTGAAEFTTRFMKLLTP